MSLIAASQDDIDEGKHAALADLYFLLTLDASLVDAAEKQASKNELLEGIKKHSALKSIKFIFFLFISFVNQFLPLLFSSLLFPCSSNIHFSPTNSDTFPFFFSHFISPLPLPPCLCRDERVLPALRRHARLGFRCNTSIIHAGRQRQRACRD